MLRIDRLTVRFGSTTAVDDVSVELPEGSVLAVLGPSGCGKSTLLRAVAGLERPSAGTISLDGRSLADVPTHRRGFAMMFQDGQLFPHLDVAGNVGYPLARQGIRGAAARAEVARLLDLVGLGGYADRRTATLSGGESQRVALARALAAGPRLLLLDEPLSALDRSLRERLAADLRDVLVATGTTALLVTHDHGEAFAVADRTALMRAGRVVQQGVTADVWRHPLDEEAALFLGFETVLRGPAAAAALASADPATLPAGPGDEVRELAVRPHALLVGSVGPLRGQVRALVPTPDGTRVLVDVEGIGSLSGRCEGPDPQVGESVRSRFDPSGLAPVGLGSPGNSPLEQLPDRSGSGHSARVANPTTQSSRCSPSTSSRQE